MHTTRPRVAWLNIVGAICGASTVMALVNARNLVLIIVEVTHALSKQVHGLCAMPMDSQVARAEMLVYPSSHLVVIIRANGYPILMVRAAITKAVVLTNNVPGFLLLSFTMMYLNIINFLDD